jgi:proteic killer suppression protein
MLVTPTLPVIASFRHRGLKRLYEKGDRRRINAVQLERIELILADLQAAATIDHMRQPRYRLHALRGPLADYYSVDVSGNWRIVFRFADGHAIDIDLVDYH